MKHSYPRWLAIGGLLAAGALSATAQTTNTLKIYTAMEVEFETEIGRSYTLQGSVNFTNWTDVGNPVLGHGRTVNRIFSTRTDGALNYASYRLHITDGPTNGFAPWSVAGARVQMDDTSSSNYVEYVSDVSGRDNYGGAFDPFTYRFARLNANEALVDRTFTPDRHELVTYTYTAPGVGTWVREEYRQSSLERRVLGVFRYLANTTNSLPGVTNPPVVITPPQPPSPPNLLTGLVYYVQSGSRPDKLTFQTATAGLETPIPATGDENENEVSPGGNSFSYTYHSLSSNFSSLVVNFGYYGFGGDKNEYDLTYTDGPSGTFVRRIYRLGSLYSTDTGAFSPYDRPPVPPGGTNTPPPVGTNPPPVNPVGLTYTVLGGNVPERLVFQTISSGIDFDDSAPTDFSFTYESTGATTFRMVVRFKPDRWHEYDLTFANGVQGTYVRRKFRNNALDRTDSGTFSVALTGN